MFRQVRGRVMSRLREAGPFRRFCTAVYLKLSHHHDMLGLPVTGVVTRTARATIPRAPVRLTRTPRATLASQRMRMMPTTLMARMATTPRIPIVLSPMVRHPTRYPIKTPSHRPLKLHPMISLPIPQAARRKLRPAQKQAAPR
jgi:hypothetical protein